MLNAFDFKGKVSLGVDRKKFTSVNSNGINVDIKETDNFF